MVGVSAHPGKFGFAAFHNIAACGYKGELWGTNRSAEEVLGRSTYPSVAELPPGQEAEHDGKELTDSRWLTPNAALDLRLTGEIKLPQPTRRNLDLMKDFGTVDELLAWAAGRHRENITSICPVQVFVDGKEMYPIPGDEHYPETA